MTELTALATALMGGIRGGLHPNPLVGLISAGLAAVLLGAPKTPRERERYAWATLVVGWLIGDGLWVLGRARDVYDGVARLLDASQPMWAEWVTLGTWALVSFAVGYLVPVLLGKTVGRRVTHGTGWLAAGSVAVMASYALSTLLARIS
ncbi:MAG: hypothetical protein Q7J82_03050 [Coriobacteriia bacterium]|nr:hypothetical protein [Coriobacteriia bacterium]